jgi:hypothetical protein
MRERLCTPRRDAPLACVSALTFQKIHLAHAPRRKCGAAPLRSEGSVSSPRTPTNDVLRTPEAQACGKHKLPQTTTATTTATATPITIITSTTCHKRATFEMEHLVSSVKHVNLDTKPVVFNTKHAIFDTSYATFDTDNAIFI